MFQITSNHQPDRMILKVSTTFSNPGHPMSAPASWSLDRKASREFLKVVVAQIGRARNVKKRYSRSTCGDDIEVQLEYCIRIHCIRM